jgi:hypothetical protein
MKHFHNGHHRRIRRELVVVVKEQCSDCLDNHEAAGITVVRIRHLIPKSGDIVHTFYNGKQLTNGTDCLVVRVLGIKLGGYVKDSQKVTSNLIINTVSGLIVVGLNVCNVLVTEHIQRPLDYSPLGRPIPTLGSSQLQLVEKSHSHLFLGARRSRIGRNKRLRGVGCNTLGRALTIRGKVVRRRSLGGSSARSRSRRSSIGTNVVVVIVIVGINFNNIGSSGINGLLCRSFSLGVGIARSHEEYKNKQEVTKQY